MVNITNKLINREKFLQLVESFHNKSRAARELKISRATIHKIINNERGIGADVAKALLDYCLLNGLDFNKFLGE